MYDLNVIDDQAITFPILVSIEAIYLLDTGGEFFILCHNVLAFVNSVTNTFHTSHV